MKALEWQRFFSDQKAQHGKVVFSVAELANVARTSLHAVNTELGRLVARGVINRYAQGWYGPAQGMEAEDVLSAVDPGAYITGFFALFRRRLVTQAPMEVTCFSNRRHNRKSDRSTPAGRLRFICVPPTVYAKPAGAATASAEQALCDFVWLNLRSGIEPHSLVTFRNLHTLSSRRLNKILRRYPTKVRLAVARIISSGICKEAQAQTPPDARSTR